MVIYARYEAWMDVNTLAISPFLFYNQNSYSDLRTLKLKFQVIILGGDNDRYNQEII